MSKDESCQCSNKITSQRYTAWGRARSVPYGWMVVSVELMWECVQNSLYGYVPCRFSVRTKWDKMKKVKLK